ncbi:oxidoreductase [Sporosarcina sp. P13]|uniref:DoxX family protein n=1 Tax=Sporosarcina sp. P13 TaxID=2048263 RepID=UPI000C166E69|nr:DoxX family protein [Sporosarcina sp. P13]PIC62846.1 oxidoreductase [Sporosarcina sp. P13]
MTNRNEIGTLLLRVVFGLVFLANGVSKFQGGIGNTADWFESIGIPGFLAYAVGLIELVGGIALILGIGTRVVSLLLGMIMLGAIFMVKLPAGFLDGYVLDLVLLVIAVHMVMNGSKLCSLGHVICKGKDY